MDKNTKSDAKINQTVNRSPRVIPMPGGVQRIHKTFGLWICKTLSKVSFAPRRELHPRSFAFYSLSHLIDGDGWYWNAATATVTRLKAGQGVLSVPGSVHFYSGYDRPYVEDALCFTGPIADFYHQSGIIRDGAINVGKTRKLLPVIEMASDPSRDAQIKANIALQALLAELYFQNQKKEDDGPSSRVGELLTKINENRERPWTVEEMAEFCNFSVNHFRRVFFAETGMNPKEYVDTVKINKAAEALCDGSVSLADISQRLGYADQYHFSRRFKAIKGLSPKNYLNSL